MYIVCSVCQLDGDAGDMSPDDVEQKKVFLIIGPASVLFNWVNELETWGHFGVGSVIPLISV